MIKVLNKKNNTYYILTDKTFLDYSKKEPNVWIPVKVGVLKGGPAVKATEEEVEAIEKAQVKEEETSEEVKEDVSTKLDLDEMSYKELKAYAQRLGVDLKGNPKGETIKSKIVEVIGE